MSKQLLLVELIPSSSWFDNVRSHLQQKQWDLIRHSCYRKADYKCEICGETGIEQGFTHKVECHEIWDFDAANSIQRLIGFISLCPLCHKVKHAGLTIYRQGLEAVLSRLMLVNKWDLENAAKHLESVFDQWRKRAAKHWKLDISYLDLYKTDADNKDR